MEKTKTSESDSQDDGKVKKLEDQAHELEKQV